MGNTQRGRDHGLPGYNAYREICSVGKARDWSGLRDYIPQKYIDKLKKTYRDIEDIDLFVGGFLEEPHLDSILGPVFKCIIGDTSDRCPWQESSVIILRLYLRYSPRHLGSPLLLKT